MRVAVVGHVEWVEFVRVAAVPLPGQIAHALETWEEPGGGGAVAAAQLARLSGACSLFTALGSDELGRGTRAELSRLAVEVRAIPETEPTRRAFTYVDDTGERTITVLNEKLRPRGGDSRLPWRELAGMDRRGPHLRARSGGRGGRRGRAGGALRGGRDDRPRALFGPTGRRVSSSLAGPKNPPSGVDSWGTVV